MKDVNLSLIRRILANPSLRPARPGGPKPEIYRLDEVALDQLLDAARAEGRAEAFDQIVNRAGPPAGATLDVRGPGVEMSGNTFLAPTPELGPTIRDQVVESDGTGVRFPEPDKS